MSDKENSKGYSSVVEDQFTLAGTPRVRAPKGAGRKKKPISLTMYQSDIDDVTEAAKLLGYPNRNEFLETIIKKHISETEDAPNEEKAKCPDTTKRQRLRVKGEKLKRTQISLIPSIKDILNQLAEQRDTSVSLIISEKLENDPEIRNLLKLTK